MAPGELRQFVLARPTSQVGKLGPGERIPGAKGHVGIPLDASMDLITRGRGTGRASRKVPQNLRWPIQSPNQIPERIPPDDKSEREMGEEPAILEPLHAHHRRRDGLVYNKEVIHVSMAGGLVGRMDYSSHHAGPIGCGEQVGLEVLIASSHPRLFESPKANGGLLWEGWCSKALRHP